MSTYVVPAVGPSYKRGSVWRKWDLHVHAPDTVFNNQFPYVNSTPDWDSYLAAVETLTDISVLGITDYFGIDGYKALREFRNAGRMANIDLLLPNIEFRLDLLIPTSSTDDAAKVKKVNAHVIFSDEIAVADIEDKFLRQLHFSGQGDIQSTNEPCALSRYQLEQLGQRLKQQQTTFTDSDYAVGCKNAAISFQQLKEVLHDHRSTFAGKYLVVLATENTSLITWEGQGHLLRKVLIQGSDAIFGGQPNDRLWGLGQKGSTPDKFVQEFGKLKPCIHGSDAHSLQTLGIPAKERFCWIKADPTFEGLRQIVYEPEERVFIGDAPPNFKHPYHVIDSVALSDAPDWFSYTALPLNSSLVTIIGGKGAGKSALAELIAFAGGSDFFRSRKGKDLRELDDTFVAKASRRTPGNTKPVTGMTIHLHWADGHHDAVLLPDTLYHGLSDEKVKYLPQKFVEQVCSPENHAELLSEIERVVFQRVPKSDRLGCIAFPDLRIASTKATVVKKLHLASELEELNREIYEAFRLVESKDAKKSDLGRLRKELVALEKQKPDVSAISAPDLKKLDQLQAAMRGIEASLTSLKQQIAVIDELEAILASVRVKVSGFSVEIKALLLRIGMTEEAESFSITVPLTVDPALTVKRDEIEQEISLLTNGPKSDGLTSVTLAKQIAEASAALQLSKSKRAEFEKYEADRLSVVESITSLEAEIANITNITEAALAEKREQRREKYLDFFELLKEEKGALEKLYKPLAESLEGGGATGRKLKFTSRITFDSAAHALAGMELFDSRRRPIYRDVDVLQADFKKLVESLYAIDFDRSGTRDRIMQFRDGFLKDESGAEVKIGEQLRRSKTEEDFNNWFFNLSRYSVSYSITFEGKELSLLSPGQKGIVLLLLYLEIDQDDQRPLIIDQPEDNLDNLSVYSNLIEFFRKRKNRRQIILITHNPNLVVNTDSEQIIIASYDGTCNPKITYRAGALEETSQSPPGVREQVCSILEGGTEAFQRRELKYSLD
jgi:hypothetical protein